MRPISQGVRLFLFLALPLTLGEVRLLSAYPFQSQSARAQKQYENARRNYTAGEYLKAIREIDFALMESPDYREAMILKSQAAVALYAQKYETAGADLRRALLGHLQDSVALLSRAAESNVSSPDMQICRKELEILLGYVAFDAPEERKVFGGKEVPTRARVLKMPPPAFEPATRNNFDYPRRIKLRAVFDIDGKVKHIVVLREGSPEATREAIKAARRVEFVPAHKEGIAVPTYMNFDYDFFHLGER